MVSHLLNGFLDIDREQVLLQLQKHMDVSMTKSFRCTWTSGGENTLESLTELVGPSPKQNNWILVSRYGSKITKLKGGQSKQQLSVPQARGPIVSMMAHESSQGIEDSSDVHHCLLLDEKCHRRSVT